MNSLRVIASWTVFLYINFCALSWLTTAMLRQLEWLFDALGDIVSTFTIGHNPYPYEKIGMGSLAAMPVWILLSLFLIGPQLGPWLHKHTEFRRPWMLDEPRLLKVNAAVRWLLVLLPILAGFNLIPHSAFDFLKEPLPAPMRPGEHNPFRLFLELLMPAFAWIAVVLLTAPEFIILATSRLTGFADNLWFSGAREKKPPWSLRLARWYAAEHRWRKAEDEYARMRSYYPERLEVWQESLRVAFALGSNAQQSPESLLSEGLAHLGSSDDKEALFAAFSAFERIGQDSVATPSPDSLSA